MFKNSLESVQIDPGHLLVVIEGDETQRSLYSGAKKILKDLNPYHILTFSCFAELLYQPGWQADWQRGEFPLSATPINEILNQIENQTFKPLSTEQTLLNMLPWVGPKIYDLNAPRVEDRNVPRDIQKMGTFDFSRMFSRLQSANRYTVTPTIIVTSSYPGAIDENEIWPHEKLMYKNVMRMSEVIKAAIGLPYRFDWK